MMAKFIQPLLKLFPVSRRGRKKGGFTLTELLVSIIIAGVIISVLLAFVVDLVETEREEFARSETQRDMQTALDFMVDDLRQAVYVYDRIDLARDNGVQPLRNYIPNFNNTVPILAFWKVERLPYESNQSLPNSCATGDTRCQQVLIRRRAYSLVVYYQARNPENDPKWKGKYRIMRYVFRKYPNLPSLNISANYVDPEEVSSFKNWPFVGTSPAGSAPQSGQGVVGPFVLVDFVDEPNSNNNDREDNKCISNNANSPFYAPNTNNPPYRRIPADPSQNNNFFVCVRTLNVVTGTNTDQSTNQDVMIYLRGSTWGKVNRRQRTNQPLLTLKTQAVARGVIDKKPQ